MAIHALLQGKTPKLKNAFIHLYLMLYCATHIYMKKLFLRIFRIAARILQFYYSLLTIFYTNVDLKMFEIM